MKTRKWFFSRKKTFRVLFFHNKDNTSKKSSRKPDLVKNLWKKENIWKFQRTAKRGKAENIAAVKGNETNLANNTTSTGFIIELDNFSWNSFFLLGSIQSWKPEIKEEPPAPLEIAFVIQVTREMKPETYPLFRPSIRLNHCCL